MVSTIKRYKTDNFPVLYNANIRGENLYQVRLYIERASFMSAKSGILRMQVLLGFIEARTAVIDAVIKTEGKLHYLSVICSSIANPVDFSRILKHTLPLAIIEEIDKKRAEECISARAVRDEIWNIIPFAGKIRTVHESRRILLSLLLEYRALLTDFSAVLPGEEKCSRKLIKSDFAIPFLLFEQNETICGIPDFQIEEIMSGGNGSHILQLKHDYGKRVLICNELICIKEIDILSCTFKNKKNKGYYQISTQITGGNFDFTLVIPSFL